jgi:hypothetical protein
VTRHVSNSRGRPEQLWVAPQPRRRPSAGQICASHCRARLGRATGGVVQELLGPRDLTATMIHTLVPNRGPAGVLSPIDRLPERR